MIYRDCTNKCEDNVLINATDIGTEHDYKCPHFVLIPRDHGRPEDRPAYNDSK